MRVIKKIFRKIIKIIKKCVNLLDYIVNTSERVILLDTPEHGNLGDQAITLAEKQLLNDIFPHEKYKEVTANSINYLEKIYAIFTPAYRNILINGGGFLGSLWPGEEERFRRILKAFRKQKIIVFPQTVTFDMDSDEGMDYFRQSREIYSLHPNLIIFLRDKKSYVFMQEYFPRVQIYLVPDIVLRLKVETVHNQRKKILFCMRKDIERRITDEEYTYVKEAVHKKYPECEISVVDTVLDYAVYPKEREERVNEFLQSFEDAKLVITDRLHGMIFATICETPCIAFGNRNGKVKGVYEWIKDNPYIMYLDDVKEIQEAMEHLDIDKTYQYHTELLVEEFNPLVSVLRKELGNE